MTLDLAYAALSDPSRRAMLVRLAQQGDATVSDLAGPLPIGLPTVMKHLSVLERAGLVARRKSGRVVTVSLRPEALDEVQDWLSRTAAFWNGRIERLVQTVEEEAMRDDTSLTITRRIKAPPDAVFDAFVVPDKIALWWGPDAGPVTLAEVDPREGGRFHVRFRMEDGSEHGAHGTFEVFDRPNRLAMGWTWEDGTDPPSRVEVTLRAAREGTELTFTHARLPNAAARDSHREGWNGALDKLEARAEELA